MSEPDIRLEIVKALIAAMGVHAVRGTEQAKNIVECSIILCDYINQDSNLQLPKDKVKAPKT